MATNVMRRRAVHILSGVPSTKQWHNVRSVLEGLCIDLDAMGRHDGERPLIDEHTLCRLLSVLGAEADATWLTESLARLPGAALRRRVADRSLPSELTWFALANEVTVFDPTEDATIADLGLCDTITAPELAARVRKRFPSLEEELLLPDHLPIRIQQRLRDRTSMDSALLEITRQLGWWAALATVLLIPPAVQSAIPDASNPPDVLWPLSMFVMASTVGGWTLTVTGSCILAPDRVTT